MILQAYACGLTSRRPPADTVGCVSTPRQATPPVRARPPLTKRLRPGHWMALDYLAAAACTLVLFFSLRQRVFPNGPIWSWLSGGLLTLLLSVVLSAPVALRRRNPLALFVVSVVSAIVVPVILAAAAAMGAGTTEVLQGPTVQDVALKAAAASFLPVAYVIHLVAAQYRRAIAFGALATVVGLFAVDFLFVRLQGAPSAGIPVTVGFAVVVVWMVGYTAGQRRAYAAQLRDQAASGAVTEERLRIARELHDVVAHSMTVIAVQAGYGHHVIGDQPDRAREALGAIQATSREALTEMRRMLGVLRRADPAPFGMRKGSDGRGALDVQATGAGDTGGRGAAAPAASAAHGAGARPAAEANGGGIGSLGNGGPAPLAPAPGLADLDRLVARIANAGVAVDLRVLGSRRELPAGIDLAAFRIVQESLTNVVKHADTPACGVTVTFGENEVSVEITDDGRGCQIPATAGAGTGPCWEAAQELSGGHGLIGMRERVSLYGGELSAEPLPGRGFRVAARLPIGEGTP
jgi:signal transduction histidine kinase